MFTPRTSLHSRIRPALRRRSRTALRGALCAAAVVACAAAHAEASPTPEDAAFLADRIVQPTLRFAPCAERPSFDCATLPVPIDYKRPWAGTVSLAVIRAKSTQPARRIGMLFANPGGPGGSGVGFVLGGANAPAFIRLRERFDIVSFDVRGSNRSQALRCEVPSTDPALVPAAERAAVLDALSRDVAKQCAVPHGALITSMSSNNIARDIDILRRALGERQLTYVGLSHGTVLGAVYATLFPHNVRAMLLDAGFYPHLADGRVAFRAEQAYSFENVFQRLDQLCSADPACRLRTPGLSKAMEEVTARLAAAPVSGGNGLALDVATLKSLIGRALSDEALWPSLVDVLADALAGDYASLFQALAFAGGNAKPGVTVLSPQSIILCNDIGSRAAAAEVLPVSEAVSAVSSRIEPRFILARTAAACAQWPEAQSPIIRSLRGRTAAPVLLFGSHFDPNTPLSWTHTLAAAIGMQANVVRYQGGGHGTYATKGNACMDAVGDAYLFDLKLPPPGTSCAARPIRFNPVTTQASHDALRGLARQERPEAM